MQFSSRLFGNLNTRIVCSLMRIAVGFWSGLLLAGCAVSVRNDPQYQLFKEQFASTRYQMQQDLFLVEYPVTHKYGLEAPGSGSSVPLTIQDYNTNPNPIYWAHTQEYLEHYGSNCTDQIKILAVIKKGVTIRITKVRRENRALIGRRYSAWGRIEDPRYAQYEVWLAFVFDGGAFDRPLVPKAEYLEEI